MLFDSDCRLGRAQVKWLIERDRSARLRFAPLQSPVGRHLLRQHGLPSDFRRSPVLIEGDQSRLDSDAMLRSCAYLDSRWRRLANLRVVPRFIRDSGFRLLANGRGRVGRLASCRLERWTPPPELRPRFLGASPPLTARRSS